MDDRAPLASALSGRYDIEREIGAGGMATVYLARDLKHERRVAVKVLHPDLAAALGAERFLAEIRTTANLQHPHILPLHDSGEAGGQLFYVMPFVEGETLRARIERERVLSIGDAVRITREVLSALDYAHRHGVIHRDIKPENVLLHDGSALVADFGIALAVQTAGGQRMTQTGLSLGTPSYMSPEQAMGEKHIDARSDVYAAGAMLYEMLTGDPPFTGSTVQAIVAKVLTERPTPPSVTRDTVPTNVEQAVLTALAKLPADRFTTAAEFATALATLQPTYAGNAIGASTTGAMPPAASRLAAYIGWAVAALLAVGLMVSLLGHHTSDAHSILVQRQLTYSGDVTAVGLSPDGLWIAYLRDDCAKRDLPACTSTLEVREVDGTQSVFIGTWPNVAPDLRWTGDNRLVFRAGGATGPTAILISDRLGGTPRRIPIDASAIAVMGDGRTLIAAAGPPARQWLRRYDLATLTPLDSAPLPPNVQLQDLSVSPRDGTLAAYAAIGGYNAAIALLDPDGRMLDTMALPSRSVVRWDSAGTAVLVFDDGEAGGLGEDLLRLPVAQRHFVRVPPVPILGQLMTGTAGRFDVARTNRLALLFGQNTTVMEVGPPTPGAASQIVRAAAGAFLGGKRLSFTPDARSVVSAMSDNLGENLYLLPVNGNAPRPLTAYRGWAITGGRWAQDAVYSPDGTRLVFTRGNARDADVAMTDSSGGRDRVLVRGGSINAGWSPDWIGDDRVVIYRNGAFVAVDTTGIPRDSVVLPDSLAFAHSNFRARAAEGSVYFWSFAAHALAAADFRIHAVRIVSRSRDHALHPITWDAAGALVATDTYAQDDASRRSALFRVGLDGSVTMLAMLPAGCVARGGDATGRLVACVRFESTRDVWLAVGR